MQSEVSVAKLSRLLAIIAVAMLPSLLAPFVPPPLQGLQGLPALLHTPCYSMLAPASAGWRVASAAQSMCVGKLQLRVNHPVPELWSINSSLESGNKAGKRTANFTLQGRSGQNTLSCVEQDITNLFGKFCVSRGLVHTRTGHNEPYIAIRGIRRP